MPQPAKPMHLELDGPGPFETPEISSCLCLVAPDQSKGLVRLRLVTRDGKELEIPMTQGAMKKTLGLLQLHFQSEK